VRRYLLGWTLVVLLVSVDAVGLALIAGRVLSS